MFEFHLFILFAIGLSTGSVGTNVFLGIRPSQKHYDWLSSCYSLVGFSFYTLVYTFLCSHLVGWYLCLSKHEHINLKLHEQRYLVVLRLVFCFDVSALTMPPSLFLIYHKVRTTSVRLILHGAFYKLALLMFHGFVCVLRVLREQWIRAKYERKEFSEPGKNFTYEEGACVHIHIDTHLHACRTTYSC